MNDCKGLWGLLFGHKFINMLVESEGINAEELNKIRCLKAEGGVADLLIDALHKKKYCIICDRCGVVKYEVV